MAPLLTHRDYLILAVAGVLGAFLWPWLLGGWGLLLVPSIQLSMKLGVNAHDAVRAVTLVSRPLFALVTAACYALAIRHFYRRHLALASTIFIVALLATIIVPSLFQPNTGDVLGSITMFWEFVVALVVLALVFCIRRHA